MTVTAEGVRPLEDAEKDDRIKTPVAIDLDRIHPNEWNPNEQSDATFNKLVEEVREDGFHHPINVVPCECPKIEGLHFMIIGGEHRWKTAKVEGLPFIPAYIHENWDEQLQKLKTVRLNLISGELNPARFTKLVKGLEESIDPNLLPGLLGFDDGKEMARFIIADEERREKTFLDSLVAETKKEKHAVDSLTDIVSTLFAESGSTIDQNFMMFTYKGALQLVVLCDDPLWKKLKKVTDNLRETGESLTDFMEKAVSHQLAESEVPTA